MITHLDRAVFAASLLGLVLGGTVPRPAQAESPPPGQASPIHKVQASSERQEMTVNSSRILTLDKKIPQAQVNNPDILELTPLAPDKIQVFAKKAGVTQVNLWDENDQVYTIDVIVFGDTRELSMLLNSEFPNASLQVKPVSNGVLISGYVDQPEHVTTIVQIAEEFYPKVLSNIQVGGVHQVILHVRVVEVSRTKLRAVGFDWAQFSGPDMVRSGAAGILSGITRTEDQGRVTFESVLSRGPNFEFHIFDGSNAFFGFLEALRQNNLAKVLSEPTLVTVSGRPARFLVGGEIPVTSGGGLGVPANTEYKEYGTQVDFVPIVLGNGRIRLEVRPRVSEIDGSRSTSTAVAFRVREVDTGVEMTAGQTLAIAGLVQTRVEASHSGLPIVSELPYIGAAFRHIKEENNEVELLVLVTPELAGPMNPNEVPMCAPGTGTTSPTDCELYLKGHIEVPACCSTCNGQGCAQCSQSGFAPIPGAGIEPGMIVDPPDRTAVPGETGRPEIVPPGPRVSAPAPAPVPPANPSQPSGPSASTSPTQNRYARSQAQVRPVAKPADADGGMPGFVGPIGYDVAR